MSLLPIRAAQGCSSEQSDRFLDSVSTGDMNRGSNFTVIADLRPDDPTPVNRDYVHVVFRGHSNFTPGRLYPKGSNYREPRRVHVSDVKPRNGDLIEPLLDFVNVLARTMPEHGALSLYVMADDGNVASAREVIDRGLDSRHLAERLASVEVADAATWVEQCKREVRAINKFHQGMSPESSGAYDAPIELARYRLPEELVAESKSTGSRSSNQSTALMSL